MENLNNINWSKEIAKAFKGYLAQKAHQHLSAHEHEHIYQFIKERLKEIIATHQHLGKNDPVLDILFSEIDEIFKIRARLQSKCPPVNQQILQELATSRWPSREIKYSFDYLGIDPIFSYSMFTHGEWWKYYSKTLSPQGQEIVRQKLAEWESACDHQIKFIEVTADNPFSPVLNILECHFGNSDTYEMMLPLFNLKGYIVKASMCVPISSESSSSLERHYKLKAISHEAGHALGISGHPFNSSINSKLVSTLESQQCTVMNYLTANFSLTNACLLHENCEDNFAISPGDLDSNLCQMIYSQDLPINQDPYPETYNFAAGNLAAWFFYLSILFKLSKSVIRPLVERLSSRRYQPFALELFLLPLTYHFLPKEILLPRLGGVLVAQLSQPLIEENSLLKESLGLLPNLLLYWSLNSFITTLLDSNNFVTMSLLTISALVLDKVLNNGIETTIRLSSLCSKSLYNFFKPTNQAQSSNNLAVSNNHPNI